jgi:hypothetical protein
MDLWAVSLNFQLALLVPFPAYLFSCGDAKRTYGYLLVFLCILLSIGARAASVILVGIDAAPVGIMLSENRYYLQKMPWARAGEYCLGMLCCFSMFDARADEPPSFLDVYYIAAETHREWLQSVRVVFATTLQTVTLGAGFLFIFEGTLQVYKLNFTTTPLETAVVLCVGDLFVASLFALLLRWAVSAAHGSWVRGILSSPLWHPIAALSYSAFLFQLAAVFWAVEVRGALPHTSAAHVLPTLRAHRGCVFGRILMLSAAFFQVLKNFYGRPIETGYVYFTQVYFLAASIALAISFGVTVLIEKPCIKLAEMRS